MGALVATRAAVAVAARQPSSKAQRSLQLPVEGVGAARILQQQQVMQGLRVEMGRQALAMDALAVVAGLRSQAAPLPLATWAQTNRQLLASAAAVVMGG